MKELKINPPEGYEIDLNKSNLKEGIIYFAEKKPDSYGEIMKYLNGIYRLKYIQSGSVYSTTIKSQLPLLKKEHVGISSSQLKSLMSLNKLINVATYLNGDWIPDTTRYVNKVSLVLTYPYKSSNKVQIITSKHSTIQYSSVYFKTKELALKAVKILGEDIIIQALTLNHQPLKR